MKKIIIIVLSVLLIAYILTRQNKKTTEQRIIKSPTPSMSSVSQKVGESRTSVFVPYWAINAELADENYDTFIYFGITADEKGVNTEDTGYANLDQFDESLGDDKEKYLALRLLNADTNLKLLSNDSMQSKIIQDVITIAELRGYDGVVLDLELSVLPVIDLTAKINTFVEKFYNEVKSNNIGFTVAIYGDTFYRNRPFDIRFIGEHSDLVMIMAYDFSKSYGEPGPNFPLNGKAIYGYDFTTMVDDFSKNVPVNKLGVIFGMYGYDWALGQQGKPLKQATAITLNQAEERFINDCDYDNCIYSVDPISKETKVAYKDDEEIKHLVWFENNESVDHKKNLLSERGIYDISYWAYGYF